MGEIQKLTIDGKSYVLLREEDYEDIIDGLRAEAIMARIEAGEGRQEDRIRRRAEAHCDRAQG